MTIFHVTDLQFNTRWFDWLQHRAPPYDLVVMSGDINSPTQLLSEIDFPWKVCVSSGTQDLEWDPRQRSPRRGRRSFTTRTSQKT
jgi:hypothetical protein